MTKQDLIAFEERVKAAFLAGLVHAPVHLSGGNEDWLLRIFQQVRPHDWVLSTWRNHYHALLKGVPPEWLYQEILAGHSMYIQNKEHRFLSSSIVGGILPIAVGLALGAKRNGTDERVWCFVGDMAAESGISHESIKYAGLNRLPITFVIENNWVSTNTPTELVWGEHPSQPCLPFEVPESYISSKRIGYWYGAQVLQYDYDRVFPHVGVGEWVTFG